MTSTPAVGSKTTIAQAFGRGEPELRVFASYPTATTPTGMVPTLFDNGTADDTWTVGPASQRMVVTTGQDPLPILPTGTGAENRQELCDGYRNHANPLFYIEFAICDRRGCPRHCR